MSARVRLQAVTTAPYRPAPEPVALGPLRPVHLRPAGPDKRALEQGLRFHRTLAEAFPHSAELAQPTEHYPGPWRWTRPALAASALLLVLGVLTSLLFSLVASAIGA